MSYSLMIAPFDFANHKKIAAQQFRPVKYGRSEPVKELFDEKHLEKVVAAWLGGNGCICEILESRYCLSQL